MLEKRKSRHTGTTSQSSFKIEKKSVLIDASSAILLYKSGIFNQLFAIYHILMATSVYEEITRKGYPGAEVFEAYALDNKYRVLKKEDYTKKAMRSQLENVSLGRGEKDTISLYLEGVGDFIIIDDGKGAGYCKKQQIPYINALLFARILYLCRSITEKDFQLQTEKIVRLGRYTRPIIQYAARCPRDKLDCFLPN